MSFIEYNDGTALITGETRLGDCVVELSVVLKDRKDWDTWSQDGGDFYANGNCSGAIAEDLSYYVIDNENSFAIMEILQKLREAEKITIIMVTHSPECAAHAERLIRIDDGVICEDLRTCSREDETTLKAS